MMNKLTVKQLTCLFCCISACLLPLNLQAESSDQPDLEFLEFLAEWQADQGDWVDPLYMQDLAQTEYIEPSTEVQGDE